MNCQNPTCPKVLLVWEEVPSQLGGAHILMKRLFQHYPSESVSLLTSDDAVRRAAISDPFPAPSQTIPVYRRSMPRVVAALTAPVQEELAVRTIVRQGERLVKEWGIKLLFSAPWGNFFIAAYRIHKRTGVPLALYVMDDWMWERAYRVHVRPKLRQTTGDTHIQVRRAQSLNTSVGKLILRINTAWEMHRYRSLMPQILAGAAEVYSISEYMSDFLRFSFQARSSVLPPFIEVERFRQACQAAKQPTSDELSIVFTGGIYSAQLDALKNLVTVVNSGALAQHLGRPVRLKLFTRVEEEYLSQHGLCGPQITTCHVPASQVPAALGAADVLFLPFAFTDEVEHLIRTSFPTKAAEYLSSGVPILVHGPPYASITRYFSAHRAGFVVTERSTAALQQGLITAITDERARREVVDNATAVARSAHDSSRLLPAFHHRLHQLSV
jgi:glycosyltransferase involved in cell wall biosynthesis